MKIKIEIANKEDLNKVVELSKDFEKENCCNGIIANTLKDLIDKDVVVAKVDEDVIGYCYGSVEIKNRDTSFYKKGEKAFYIEEILIKPQFRNKNIGTLLFSFIEKHALSLGCVYLETVAVSKDYQKLLNFYIKKQKMSFWSASLIKKLN